MNTLKKAVVIILFISFATFVALFGRLPAFRNGPIGALYRLLWYRIPGAVRNIDDSLTGGRVLSVFAKVGRYLWLENHPIILLLFLGLVAGCQLAFIPAVKRSVSSAQYCCALFLSAVPYYFAYKCVTSTTSHITPENHHEQMRLYPYDHVLFRPGQVCHTCHFLKPARSKHCSICKRCIAKQDHHCVWIMNCVGKGNYGYFIGLLLSLAIMLTYGGYIGVIVLDMVLQRVSLRTSHEYADKHWSTGQSWTEYGNMWAYALALDNRVGGVGLLAMFTAPMAWGFLFYHLYLVWAGMTTNESSKWEDWKYMTSIGIVFKSRKPRTMSPDRELDVEEETQIPWPASTQQVIEVYEDGQVPESGSRRPFDKLDGEGRERSDQWMQVEGLHQIENLYDLGFWDNLRDILPSRVDIPSNE